MESFTRIPSHVGIIPDGNRRWASDRGYPKRDGYKHGIAPGFELYEILLEHGVKEATFYGFTKDNNKRAVDQREAFTQACVDAVELLSGRDANLLVVGNTDSPAFPRELMPFTGRRVPFGRGLMNLNFLVNYDWEWDLGNLKEHKELASHEISRIDLIVRWGGRRRLSGFLPAQSVYADFYVVDEYWPDFKPSQVLDALKWYQDCDVTLGG
ncbi:MAG TPA: undecaprenyl diphosphate synthase family protein [Terriglobales bacterium]|nr:undecaprenyl diphosphate synthase family protein [Terriglobales bacterium]